MSTYKLSQQAYDDLERIRTAVEQVTDTGNAKATPASAAAPIECECPVEGHSVGCPNDLLTKLSAADDPRTNHGAALLLIADLQRELADEQKRHYETGAALYERIGELAASQEAHKYVSEACNAAMRVGAEARKQLATAEEKLAYLGLFEGTDQIIQHAEAAEARAEEWHSLYLGTCVRQAKELATANAERDRVVGLHKGLMQEKEAELAEAKRVTFDPAVLERMNAIEKDAERYQNYANILRLFIEDADWQSELPDDVWAICQHWNNNEAIDAAMQEVK